MIYYNSASSFYTWNSFSDIKNKGSGILSGKILKPIATVAIYIYIYKTYSKASLPCVSILHEWITSNTLTLHPDFKWCQCLALWPESGVCWLVECKCLISVYTCMHAQLCSTLCNPMDYSLPVSSVHGILQARVLEWVAIPFSRGSSWARDQTRVSCIAGRSLLSEPPGKP